MSHHLLETYLEGLSFIVLKGHNAFQWILNVVHSADPLVISVLEFSKLYFGTMHGVRIGKEATGALLGLKTEDIDKLPLDDIITQSEVSVY